MKFFVMFSVLFLGSCTYLITGYTNNCSHLPTTQQLIDLGGKTKLEVVRSNEDHYNLLMSLDSIDDKYIQPIQILYRINSDYYLFYNCSPFGINTYTESILVNVNAQTLFTNHRIDEADEEFLSKLFSVYDSNNERNILIFMNSSFKKYSKNFISDYSKLSKEHGFDSEKSLIIVFDELFCKLKK